MTTPNPDQAQAGARLEVVTRRDARQPAVILPGISIRTLADSACGSSDLFAGLLEAQPAALYPHYARPVAEALTLLSGTAAVDMEDRRYTLGQLDSIFVPARTPRRVVNLAPNAPALFHVVMAAGHPTLTWVNARFTPREQPRESPGRDQGERIARDDPALRYEMSPRASFRDLFGLALGGTGVCGGLGVFEPGARVPCQRHEVDTAITVLEGTATCVVAGRRHELSDHATILIPRGCCHYVINLTLELMILIWAGAGDQPGRTVVDETLCHPEKARSARAGKRP